MHDAFLQLGRLFLAQPTPEAVPTSTIELLQQYGGWGVSVILGGTVIALAKAYKAARDNETVTLKDQNKELIALTVETNKSTSELKNALTSVASAMQGMDRRLEDVERKLGNA